MENPAVVNESTSDDVLWRRHERPTDAIYIPYADMSFRAGATAAIKQGPQSFPIIRDPSGSGGDIDGDIGEASDAVVMCRRVWLMGDPLYFDQNGNGVVDAGSDTLLSTSSASPGFVDLGHAGATLNAAPADVRYVDLDSSGSFDIGERIYRDENSDGVVDGGDTLLVETSGTVVGNVEAADVAAALLPVPANVKYLDLIRQPANTLNIGYPAVQGVTGVNANDLEYGSIAFPVHGVAALGIGGLGAVMDDPSQYLPPGPDYTLFETQLVGHEFGHSFSLFHGDGIDDDMNGILDDEDDPPAPVPGAGAGTLCDSNNVMSYCWLDSGSSGSPNLSFIGVGAATSGIFTAAQSDKIRNFVLANVPDRIVDPVTPPLTSARVDAIGELESPFEHLDIAEFSVSLDASRSSTILSLTTRRPFPETTQRVVDFDFLLDLDGNPETGGAATEAGVPTDFLGAEIVITVRLRGLEVAETSLLRYEPKTGQFSRIDPERVRAIRKTLKAVPDFPFGRTTPVPETTAPPPPREFPVAELVQVIAPTELLPVPTDKPFRVEFVSRDEQSGTLDRAGSPGMNFEPPLFPQCRTEPAVVDPGGTTNVIASGLLPDREVHLLLGADEVASGHTDGAGDVTLAMNIPASARLGPRLVTVGALAVSADCTVTVRDPNAPPEDGEGLRDFLETCCRRLKLHLWVLTILVLIVLVLILLRRR